MRNIWLVLRFEIAKTLRSPGYMIFAYILPVAAILILAAVQYFQTRNSGQADQTVEAPIQFEIAVEGYVDLCGLIQQIPEEFPPDRLIRFEDEAQAQKALQNGEITAYYVIPSDFIARGRLDYVYPNTRSYLQDGQPWVMEKTVLFNLLDGDAERTDQAWNLFWEVVTTNIMPQPSEVPGDNCSRPGSACQSNDLVRYLPSIMTALFFASFMTSSSRLFNSVGIEKENRLMEIILLSVSPRHLLAGKTLGLGLAGLLQAIFWLGTIFIAFNLGGSTLHLPEQFSFPLNILAWSLLFFLGGFGFYASLMAGAGALVPKMKEAGIANYIAMFPLFIGYSFGFMAPLAEASNTALLIFLSILPFTSPVVMPMRLTDNLVPPWQLLLALGLLFTTAYFTLHAVAAMFHAQNLLSGGPFSLRRYLNALLGR